MSTDPFSIDVPQGVDVMVERGVLKVKGPKAELQRPFPHKSIMIKSEGQKVLIDAKDKSSSSRALVGTFNSHLKNMIAGVQQPYIYKLKIAYTHFPITVTATGSEFSVQNFLGEKKPRKVKIPQGAKVTIQGDKITIESADIEIAGKTATLIELSTKIRNRDRRVFQDGIFLTERGK